MITSHKNFAYCATPEEYRILLWDLKRRNQEITEIEEDENEQIIFWKETKIDEEED